VKTVLEQASVPPFTLTSRILSDPRFHGVNITAEIQRRIAELVVTTVCSYRRMAALIALTYRRDMESDPTGVHSSRSVIDMLMSQANRELPPGITDQVSEDMADAVSTNGDLQTSTFTDDEGNERESPLSPEGITEDDVLFCVFHQENADLIKEELSDFDADNDPSL
jgi:hypothetical protein